MRLSLFRRRQPHCFELGLCFAELGQDFERFVGLPLVDPAHGEPDVDEDPVVDTGLHRMRIVDDTGDVDLPPHPTDVDRRELSRRVIDSHDSARNTDAHVYPRCASTPAAMSWAAPIAACPSARPPSFAGTSECASTENLAVSSRLTISSNRTRFWKQPPDSPTVSKTGPPPCSR